MTINLDHIDELYLLQEAVDAFLESLDRQKQWRAVVAAEAIAEKLALVAQSNSSRRAE